jgi:NADH:ubiquinone oxidoreductase subunit 6 (subunit J)
MNAASIAFYVFAGVAALSALAILFTRNVFYAVLLLIVCLLSIAAIYIVAIAEFVAVTQILIYAGGILVLIIFGVMLTSKISGKALIVQNQYTLRAPLVGLSVFTLLCILFSKSNYYQAPAIASDQKFNAINHIGILLMSDYAFPLEVAGILLLVALIGAAVIASSFNPTKKH